MDYHHTVEDIGIALGRAFREALGDKKGIYRYGSMLLPMDEALILTAVDVGGRSSVNFDVEIPAQKVGDFDTELVKEFVLALAREMGLTVHIRMLAGENAHRIVAGIFKSLGRWQLASGVRHRRGICGRDPIYKRSVIDDCCDRLRSRKPVFPLLLLSNIWGRTSR